MNSSRGVHIAVTSAMSPSASAKYATFDSGTTSAAETLTDGSAIGYLRVTRTAAYFSGNAAGLADFFGVPKRDAARIGDRWVSARAGTSQYASLATGSLVASIPATILPASDSVTVTPATADGVPVYQLAWKSFIASGTTPVSETLDLRAAGDHTPVRETSVSGRATQTAIFTRWGIAPTVAVPPHAIPFATATSG